MKYAPVAVTLTLAVLAMPARAQQQPTYKREIPDSLVKSAKITEAMAVATAEKRVKNGKVESAELERQKGRLIYSFDLKVPGRSGMEEVNVDANSGKVLKVFHESAKTEQKEAAKDAKQSAKPATPKPAAKKP